MKKIGLALLSMSAIMAISCSQKNSVVGRIDGWGNDTIMVTMTTIDGHTSQDTVYSEKGKFVYDVAPTDTVQLRFTRQNDIKESPSRGIYTNGSRSLNVLVVGGEKISIKGDQEGEKLTYKAKGSEFEESRSALHNELAEVLVEIDRMQNQADSMILANAAREAVMPLFEKQQELMNRIKGMELDYIKANFNNQLSGFLLASQPIDTTAKYFESLGEPVRNGVFKVKLQRNLDQYQIKLKKAAAKEFIQVGKVAPNFTLTALDGSQVALYDIAVGKYIMLDFWGNWCGWCVKGFPEMKKAYAKHASKLEIVGIDCGDSEKVWKAAVAKLELPWTQLINGQGDNDLTVMYAVEGFPTKIIMAPDHTILEIAVGETPDFYTKLEQLVK